MQNQTIRKYILPVSDIQLIDVLCEVIQTLKKTMMGFIFSTDA